MKTKLLPLVLGGCLCATLAVAFEKGKSAYTKRYETDLLEEPKPLAKSVAKLAIGQEVKITELEGRWAKVAMTVGEKSVGWIYLGNLAEERPVRDTSIEGLGNTAGATTASVAARPLDSVAQDYANQKGLKAAAADVTWLEGQSDALKAGAVKEYLQTQKKGEFQ